ncbi:MULTISPECIES: YajD family HNH nuclease [Methylomonas]|uniref:YajD family HNH nuclease n=1 Tax=Methylomonas TaxID=416 RepID=UPI00123233CD|nr:YajD family HNH nuclease [Methylomonas rhizoryzae]
MSKANQIIAEARRYKEEREKGYREQALKLFPWICGRCAREFDHKNLRELTVHHKNHDHDHNPADGSNWELLCLYCHDNEHQRYESQVRYGSSTHREGSGPTATFSPFADLKKLMQNGE